MSPGTKKARHDVVTGCADQLEEMQGASTGRKDQCGSVMTMAQEARRACPWTNENVTKCEAERIKKKINFVTPFSDMSSREPPPDIGDKGGRPTGNTNTAKAESKRKEGRAKMDTTKKLRLAKQNCQQHKSSNGTFQTIHDEVSESHGLLDTGFKVPMRTVRCHLLVNTNRIICGPVSPVADIEPTMLTFCKYRQETGQPMRPSEGLKATNSLIKGSVVEENLKQHQKTCRKEQTGVLSKSWWRGFKKRHGDILNIAKGHHLVSARED